MKTWRLLDTPPMSAAENMALDETLVELKGRGGTPDTIRFLRFSPGAVLIGYHQSVQEEVRTDYCISAGVEVNRRITGGGAIFFDETQLGWEVICNKSFFGLTLPTPMLFKTLCDPVVTALDLLGLEASFRPRNDIEIRGRKISGTGGTESDGAFLFQGTMLTDFDVDTMLRCLKIPIEKLKAKEIDSVKERVTCLKWELGRTPALEEIKGAIRAGFERHLGIHLEPGELTDEERSVFREKIPLFRSSEWINLVNPKYSRQEVVQSAYKGPEGMVKFTVVVNVPGKRIKDLYITGDFLSFPPGALFGLEAALKGLPLRKGPIHEALRGFFDRGLIHIPGMSIRDFLKPMDQVIEKFGLTRYGIPLEYCNLISVTNGTFEEVLRKDPSVLLLPYCSKQPDCDLRNEKGCRVCGECSVGDAYVLGSDRKMDNVCILSFEDLMDELGRMKREGIRAFIGCCCQPFFVKHADDFERAGLPGILLDIENTTCYELDQAKEAYAGRFESQTHLNLGLLKLVLGLQQRLNDFGSASGIVPSVIPGLTRNPVFQELDSRLRGNDKARVPSKSSP
jgi:lipoate-protein ligase A